MEVGIQEIITQFRILQEEDYYMILSPTTRQALR